MTSFDTLPATVAEINRKLDFLMNSIGSTMPENNPDRLLTVEQLADYLPEKPARQTIYAWVNNRLVPYEKFGKRLYFRLSAIEKWLNNGRRV